LPDFAGLAVGSGTGLDVTAGAGAAAGAWSLLKDKVRQEEVTPSLLVQDHVHGPSPLTALGVPARHKSVEGAS
jgi:hypothetical protein